MELCLLVTQQMYPIPDGLETIRNYGTETVIVESTDGSEPRQIQGDSVHLSGDSEIFIKWLQPFSGVWISNSPASGDWYVVHVKKAA